MSTTITLEDPAARALAALGEQAAARNLPLDRYLQSLADNSERILGPMRRSPHDLSAAEFEQWLLDLPAGMPDVPPLPDDFSRADIYNDHD
jgi:hypothetical protein